MGTEEGGLADRDRTEGGRWGRWGQRKGASKASEREKGGVEGSMLREREPNRRPRRGGARWAEVVIRERRLLETNTWAGLLALGRWGISITRVRCSGCSRTTGWALKKYRHDTFFFNYS